MLQKHKLCRGLLNIISGVKRKYIHLSNTDKFGIGIHMPAKMLDEEAMINSIKSENMKKMLKKVS